MRPRAVLALAAVLASAAASAKAVPPAAPQGRVTEHETSLRAFVKAGRYDALGDLTLRSDRGEKALTLGGYRRVHRNLKLGLFYRLQQGARHDDDWRRRAARSTAWEWEDTRRRSEHVLILDATPRFGLGGGWVLFLKNQLLRNTRISQSFYKVAPELAWFWRRGLAPAATFYLRAEADLALDRGAREFVDRWAYVGALWHVSPRFSIGPHAALRDWVWRTSLHSPPQDRYRVVHRSSALGLTAVGRFGR